MWILLQSELQSHLPFDLSMKKACRVLSQVCFNHVNTRGWRGDGLLNRVSPWLEWGKAGVLPSRGGEVRNGSRCSGNGEEEIPKGVGGRNWKIVPTFMPFFFGTCFYSASASRVQRLMMGQKEQLGKPTWKSNSRKEVEQYKSPAFLLPLSVLPFLPPSLS